MSFKHKLSARLALLKDILLLAPAALLFGCEKPARLAGPGPVVTRIVVSPAQVALKANQTSAFMAVGLTATGDTGSIPVTWHATGGIIADTSSTGGYHRATYQPTTAPGTYLVVAASAVGGLADTSTVTVVPMPVASVTLTPAVASMLVATSLQLVAAPQDSTGAPLSGRLVTWSSSAPAVVAVNGSGLVTAAAAGSATVTATSEGKTGSATITVTTVPVATVTVSPASATIALGATQQLSAVTKDSAGSTLTGRVLTWASSNSSAATVSASGLVTGKGAGSATISATSEGMSGSAGITVINVPVATVTVSPASATVLVGATQQLSAVTKDSAGNTLTGRVVTWTSNNSAVAHAGYYVTPSGSSSGNGSTSQPWNLTTALAGAGGRVQPGDTIWLRGGRYSGSFTSTLNGTASSPIVVRQYPGERATIDGALNAFSGSYVWFWGFEIMQSVHGGSTLGVFVQTPGIRLINLVVHDATMSGIYLEASGALDSHIYGCICYNNGDHADGDHGIYTHTQGSNTGALLVEDNITFNNIFFGLHGFATGGADQTLRNVTMRGNVSFNNNSLATVNYGSDLLLGGYQPGAEVVNGVVDSNYIWRNSTELNDFAMWIGFSGITGSSISVTNNYGASPTPIHIYPFTTVVNTGNAIYQWGVGGAPTTNRVVVRPNRYEPGRATIIVYNWTQQGSVSVDVSGLLTMGDRYVVQNVQDFYGTPVASGTYGGGALQLPMAGITPPTPIGRATNPAPVTGPAFNVFVLMKTS